jgi:nucleoporin NUP82
LHIATAIILQDSDIGYLLLTSLNHQPYSANLDIPLGEHERRDFDALIAAQEKDIKWLLTPREPYHEDQTFHTPTQLLQLLKTLPPHMQNYYREEVRLSPASLDVLIQSHRVVKVEVHRIADAAALLYERCGRLMVDLREQVGEVGKVADRVDLMAGGWDGEEEEEGEEDGDRGMIKRIEDRVNRMRERQRRILEGFGRVKRLAVRLDGKEVSEKEKAFARELEKLASRLDPTLVEDGGDGKGIELKRRFGEVKALKERLVAQAKQVVQQDGDQEKREEKLLKVSSEFRKAKEVQVMDMLERESALIEAVTERLNRLGV